MTGTKRGATPHPDGRSELQTLQSGIRTKSVIALLVLTVVILALLLFAAWLGGTGGSRVVTVTLSFAAAIVAGLIDYFTLRPLTLKALTYAVDAVDDAVGLDQTLKQLGFSNIIQDQHIGSALVEKVLKESTVAHVVLNHGSSWVSNYREALRVRCEDPSKETHVLLMDPDSEFLPALAAREERTPDRIKAKIEEALDGIRELVKKTDNPRVFVYGYRTLISASIVVGDNDCIYSPYLCSPRGDQRRPPKFSFARMPNGGEGVRSLYEVHQSDTLELRNSETTRQLLPPTQSMGPVAVASDPAG